MRALYFLTRTVNLAQTPFTHPVTRTSRAVSKSTPPECPSSIPAGCQQNKHLWVPPPCRYANPVRQPQSHEVLQRFRRKVKPPCTLSVAGMTVLLSKMLQPEWFFFFFSKKWVGILWECQNLRKTKWHSHMVPLRRKAGKELPCPGGRSQKGVFHNVTKF